MEKVAESFLSGTVEKIESSYEFMLAYAAQGRDSEQTTGGGGPSIRNFLVDLEAGLEKIVYAFAEKKESLALSPSAEKALNAFLDQLGKDADSALGAVRVVLTVPSISSQLVDNLNASAHLRCLLTDVFLLDEALSVHQRLAG